jgi:hypothetical protein
MLAIAAATTDVPIGFSLHPFATFDLTLHRFDRPLRGAWFPWMDRQSRTTATTYLNSD